MTISAIVAVAQNGVIGHNNQIPWYLSADLIYFKRTTIHHSVIMGRKCYASIGRPLPKRNNIVITRDLFFVGEGLIITNSLEEALQWAFDHGETEAFIIGGGEIYRQSIHYWDKIYLTEVDCNPEGDILFPTLDPQEWKTIQSESHKKNEKNEYDYTFKILERIPS
jgi:dihydrofolate reductase